MWGRFLLALWTWFGPVSHLVSSSFDLPDLHFKLAAAFISPSQAVLMAVWVCGLGQGIKHQWNTTDVVTPYWRAFTAAALRSFSIKAWASAVFCCLHKMRIQTNDAMAKKKKMQQAGAT